MFSNDNIIIIPSTNYGNYEQYTSNTAINNFLMYLIGILYKVKAVSGNVK